LAAFNNEIFFSGDISIFLLTSPVRMPKGLGYSLGLIWLVLWSVNKQVIFV